MSKKVLKTLVVGGHKAVAGALVGKETSVARALGSGTNGDDISPAAAGMSTEARADGGALKSALRPTPPQAPQ